MYSHCPSEALINSQVLELELDRANLKALSCLAFESTEPSHALSETLADKTTLA